MKINDWNSIGARTKGRPKNRWKDEEINGIKKITEKLETIHQI
jgi:hypothetical protein